MQLIESTFIEHLPHTIEFFLEYLGHAFIVCDDDIFPVGASAVICPVEGAIYKNAASIWPVTALATPNAIDPPLFIDHTELVIHYGISILAAYVDATIDEIDERIGESVGPVSIDYEAYNNTAVQGVLQSARQLNGADGTHGQVNAEFGIVQKVDNAVDVSLIALPIFTMEYSAH